MDRSLRDRDSCLGETRLREQTKAVVRDVGVGAGYALVLGAGNGELPCVGRLVIEQVAGLRSVGIYTGRILWEAPVAGLGSYYNNTSHQYGANGTGTNYISTSEAIYVRYLRECLRLDPATGRPLPSIPLPAVAAGGETIWGYLNVVNDYLVGGIAMPDKSIGSLKWLSIPLRRTAAAAVKEVPQAIESQSLFVLDRHSGKLLWSAVAQGLSLIHI